MHGSASRLSRHYAPAMRKQGCACIMFISSGSGVQIPVEMIHFGVTKTAQLLQVCPAFLSHPALCDHRRSREPCGLRRQRTVFGNHRGRSARRWRRSSQHCVARVRGQRRTSERRPAPHTLYVGCFSARCFLAVTSISIFIRGSDRPAEIMVAAGRTSPKHCRSNGQQGSKSSARGRM